jgi:cellulose synthase/poly-beta-1,6-N-acetylglucosamine synthase-like glycosyltransferase
MMTLVSILLVVALLVVAAVTARQYLLTLQRLYGRYRQPYLDLATAPWPSVAVFIPCRDEKQIGPLMMALLAADYPAGRLTLIPIDDPESPGTSEVLDEYAVRFPGKVIPFHRARREGERAGALREASEHAGGREAPIHLVFDGEYRPGRELIKQLVAPFFDPEVGAVFARIVPANGSPLLLPRLLELERAAASQVEQQARVNFGQVPEVAAPVSAVRREALVSAGGWRDTASECLELGYRLSEGGWEIVYQNRAECYENVPEEWPAWLSEVEQGVRGRNQILVSRPWAAGLDGFHRVARPAVTLFLLVAWAVALIASYTGDPLAVVSLAVLTVALYTTAGNCAGFFATASAAWLDGTGSRVRLLPFVALAGLPRTLASAWTTVRQLVAARRLRRPKAARVAPAPASLATSEAKDA